MMNILNSKILKNITSLMEAEKTVSKTREDIHM
jgi:hypothetical protein